jgi:hypothetical protein
MHRLGMGIALSMTGIAAPVVAEQAQTTIQQDFDAATALYVKGDYAGALTAWDALDKRAGGNRRTKAGTETMAGARYSKTYRPDGGLGCGGTSQRVRFVLPFKH